MTKRLRGLSCMGLAILASLLAGCETESLTPAEEQRLHRIYLDMPARQRIGIEQNLRFAGLYSGELNPDRTKR